MSQFKELLNRYTRANGGAINRRKSAKGFQELMNKGSFGAALTFGLLSAESDEADQEQLMFQRETTLAELGIRQEQQQTQKTLSSAQAQQIKTETDIRNKTGIQSEQTKISVGEAQAKELGTRAKTRQQEANTNQYRAETDAEYKAATLDIDGRYKKGLISLEEKNLELRTKKVESEVFLQIRDLNLKQQKLAIDAYIAKGQLTIQGANSVTSRITANSNAGLTNQQTLNAKASGQNIVAKDTTSMAATTAQTERQNKLNEYIDQQEKLKEDQGRQKISESAAVTGNIDANAANTDEKTSYIAANQEQQRLLNAASLFKFQSQNKNATYELMDKKFANLQTVQAIDQAIAKNSSRKPDDGFFSSVGNTIFGEDPEEDKIKKARLATLKYLQQRRAIYAKGAE